MKTAHIKSIVRSLWGRGFIFVPVVLAWFAVPTQVRAVCQQGCDQSNTFLGEDAFLHNTAGDGDTAIGVLALTSNTTGDANTAIGANALFNNTIGGDNTAIGAFALGSNTGGVANTATGSSALSSNTIGSNNTASGEVALAYNSTGSYNTAHGNSALYRNATGNNNTAIGSFALVQNTTASSNTATGFQALGVNTTGFRNTANGAEVLFNNQTGANNTAEGYQALYRNNGSSNVAVGFQALYNNSGSNNVALGFQAGLNLNTGSNNLYLGSRCNPPRNESNTTRISNIYSSAASGRAVYVDSSNKIGTLMSSRRFKEKIKPMDKASEAILALKPVTFQYKKEIEPNGGMMFGLIAEDVEQVDPDLVIRDDKGQPESVRYEAVNAMLLNEFLKEHRKVEAQEAAIRQLNSTVTQQQNDFQATVAQLTRRLDEQASQIRQVNAQLAAGTPARGGLAVNGTNISNSRQ